MNVIVCKVRKAIWECKLIRLNITNTDSYKIAKKLFLIKKEILKDFAFFLFENQNFNKTL